MGLDEWIPAWGYRETDFSLFPIHADNETQRLWFFNNVRADALRLRFSNRYGREPLPMRQITIAECSAQGALCPGTTVAVRFDENPSVTLAPGEVRYSDPVEFDAEPGTWLCVSIYVADRVRITGAVSSQSRLVTRMSCQKGGNYCESPLVFGERFLDEARAFMALKPLYNMVAVALTQVEMRCAQPQTVTTVVAFGDSITQHGHWSEALALRLYDAAPDRVTLVNRGICGNRVLHDASIRSKFGGYFGEGALERFEEDAFASVGGRADCVLLEEGVNDIIQPFDHTCAPYEKVTAEDVVAGYRKMAKIAHAHGAKAFVATVMPFRGFNDVWNESSERMRAQINRQLAEDSIFDAVLDFASVICDRGAPERIANAFNCGDNLHPNAEGGRVLAGSIDLPTILNRSGKGGPYA